MMNKLSLPKTVLTLSVKDLSTIQRFIGVVEGITATLPNEKQEIVYGYLDPVDEILNRAEIVGAENKKEKEAEALPDDVVKVVRCLDCRFYNICRLECRHPHHNGNIGHNGFCSYGERKE